MALLISPRCLLVFMILACPLGSLAAQNPPHAPNILLILADDLRPQLGCYGDQVVKTPHLDRFARRALRFDRAYVHVAVCSPSRNSFLSGLRPETTGLRGFGRTRLRQEEPGTAGVSPASGNVRAILLASRTRSQGKPPVS